MNDGSPTLSILYGKLVDLRADIDRLRRYYHEAVEPTEATPYFDHGAEYEGWSITSRDGTVADGVKQIPFGQKTTRGTTPTALCKGVMTELLDEIEARGLQPFRARVMRLTSGTFEMKFHRDAKKEAWRLHVPIITNPGSYFEWKLGSGRIERVHLPADGSAWFVRVDVLHRAVNISPTTTKRVHLLMSIGTRPVAEAVEAPCYFEPQAEAPAPTEQRGA
jgi:hypothetical protein